MEVAVYHELLSWGQPPRPTAPMSRLRLTSLKKRHIETLNYSREGTANRHIQSCRPPWHQVEKAAMVEDLSHKSSSAKEYPKTRQTSASRAHWYSPPEPIRRAFDRFPLRTYPSNALPGRAPRDRKRHILHIFASEDTARQGNPSHNPACLKWQAYLKFAGIEFVTTSSNNHASPSGSLPFILPADSRNNRPATPVPSSRIMKWASSQTGQKEDDAGMCNEAYSSLLDHRIRSAWLYHLYLDPANFSRVAVPLYIATTSSNRFVRLALGRQLQQAARDELVKYTSVIDGQELLDRADRAFEALSVLLGDDEFFFGHGQPGLFDASVFAYTYLLLSNEMEWEKTAMTRSVKKYTNLVQHQHRLQMDYFPE